MRPSSYNRCALLMVLLTENPNFLAASCCNVEVVNGAAGAFLAGFFSKPETLKSAFMFASKNF